MSDRWFLTVDGKRFDWVRATIMGTELRALVPGLNPAFGLVREQRPLETDDQPVREEESISLDDEPSFYSVAPSTFG